MKFQNDKRNITQSHFITLKMPIKYVKNNDGEFVCPECNMTTKNQSTMHYHMKKHMKNTKDEFKYECEHCDKVFLQKQSLLVHMRFKHPDELEENTVFECPFDCDFTSPAKGNCIIHMIRVHFQEELQQIMFPQAGTKNILCGGCQKEFKSNSAFIYHCKNCLNLSEETQKNAAFKTFL